MRLINKLAEDSHLTIEGLEQAKRTLEIRREYEKLKFTESSNQLIQNFNSSFSFLSLLNRKRKGLKKNQSSKIKSFSWIQGAVIGYKIIKLTRSFLKKRKMKK